MHAGSVLAFLLIYLKTILRTPWLSLFVALCLFGVSMLCDLLPYDQNNLGDVYFLLEDAPKTVGILFWALYCINLSKFVTRRDASALNQTFVGPPSAEEALTHTRTPA